MRYEKSIRLKVFLFLAFLSCIFLLPAGLFASEVKKDVAVLPFKANNIDFEFNAENCISLYDEIAEIINESYPEFMHNSFNTTLDNGKIVKVNYKTKLSYDEYRNNVIRANARLLYNKLGNNYKHAPDRCMTYTDGGFQRLETVFSKYYNETINCDDFR